MQQAPPDRAGAPNDLAESELARLETLFEDMGLKALRARVPQHPAVQRYDALLATVSGVAIRWPDETDQVATVGTAFLDSLEFDSSPIGETWSRLADSGTLHQIRSRLRDPEQFLDQLAVLRCWSLITNAGTPAEIRELEGFPDIQAHPSADDVWVEVKRIRPGTPATRVRAVLKKANSQLKKAHADASGIAYVAIERPIVSAALDDSIPSFVTECIGEAKRELASGNSKSVGRVIIVWDDLIVLGEPPQATMYFFRRRTISLDHHGPRSIPTLATGEAFGRTVALSLNWEPGNEHRDNALLAISDEKVVFTQQFRQVCEQPGYVRTSHARGALAEPTAQASWSLGDLDVIITTKRVTIGQRPFTLLIVASQRPAQAVEVALAFRLYDDEAAERVEPIWTNPARALAILLERHGLTVRVGEQVGLLIPTASVPASNHSGMIVEVLGRESAPEGLVHSIVRVEEKTIFVSWAFAINSTSYRKEMNRFHR
jgi:hypothetical protein